MASFSERPALDITDAVADVNNENNAESANIKKKDVVLKKPQASLLKTYNQQWKHVHNHFLRHSDVKARDDRRPSVMDLANQPNVAQRVNGWKTHLICGEITEMVLKRVERVISFLTFLILSSQINDETREMEMLNSVLKRLETDDLSSEAEKISELIKVN